MDTGSGYVTTPGGLLMPPQMNAQVATSAGWQNYSAANRSTGRGYVYFPDLNSERELKPQARLAILSKARWVCRNIGLGARFRNGIADMVGYQTPQPKTNDQEWNEEIMSLANEFLGNPLIFDRAGQENFFERQITLTKLSLQDGDVGLALSEDDEGNLQTTLYQSPQIANPIRYQQDDGWWDGVRTDKWGRHQEYCLLDSDLMEEATRIDAADFIHFHQSAEPGAIRGVSAFAPFVDRMLDVREIDNDELRGIKASNLVGFYLKNTAIQNAANIALMERRMAADAFGGEATAAAKKAYNLEQITRGGGTLAELDIGQEFATVHDDRRNPNRAALVDYFIRDMSWGSRYAPEILWFIGDLTGPGVRYIIRQGERASESYRLPMRQKYCRRIWAKFTSMMQEQGRIRWCRDPQFWKCDWLNPPAMIIDLGRDITSGLAEINAGGNTLENWYGEVNQDWKVQLRQRAVELSEAKELEKEFKLADGSLLGNPTVILSPNASDPTAARPSK